MDLKTFVAEALTEIIEGVRQAQAGDHGSGINAESNLPASGNLINSGVFGVFTRVDFDVAVSAESAGAGKGGIRVFGIGAAAEGEHRRGYENRICFSVPLRLPDGAKSEEYARQQNEWDRLSREQRPRGVV